MYFLDTNMHMVTFLITMFEIVMLVFQIIYFLQRPNDKSRLQYLILLFASLRTIYAVDYSLMRIS